MQKTYKVAMLNYVFNGGDGYTMFKESNLLVNEANARTDAEVLIEYAKKLGLINVKISNRIIVLQ